MFLHPEFKERWDRCFNFFMFLKSIQKIKNKEQQKEIYKRIQSFLPYKEDIENFNQFNYLIK